MSCSLEHKQRRFGETCGLSSEHSSAMKMEAESSSETSVPKVKVKVKVKVLPITGHEGPEDE